MVEPWIKKKPDPLACYDCLLPYGGPGWADFVVPDDVWAKISPTGDEGGILCATCMFRRLETQGIRCDGRFTSGPCAQSDWKKSEPDAFAVRYKEPDKGCNKPNWIGLWNDRHIAEDMQRRIDRKREPVEVVPVVSLYCCDSRNADP